MWRRVGAELYIATLVSYQFSSSESGMETLCDCKIPQQNSIAFEELKGKNRAVLICLENNTGESWRQSGSNHWCSVSTFQPPLAFLLPPSSSLVNVLHDSDGQEMFLMKR